MKKYEFHYSCIGLKGVLDHSSEKQNRDFIAYKQFEICRLAVHPNYRKHGIATSLLKVAENYAKKHNKGIL